jgi:hypothetical protein
MVIVSSDLRTDGVFLRGSKGRNAFNIGVG